MTPHTNKSRFPSMPVPKQRKNGCRVYIDPSDFYLMRRRAFLTTEKAAKLLDVTHRTILNWEKGKNRIPYTAYRVLKIKVGYLFDDEHFNDWFVKGDTLWSPEGRGFKPHELRYIGNYFWMARQWLAERQAAKPQNPTDAIIFAKAASGVSPTSSADQKRPATGAQLPADFVGTLTPCGAAPLRETAAKGVTAQSQQGKPKDFERFLESLGIAA